jgi:NADPH:quinone reductase-like Zn-dependent oxidoreductase
MLRISCETMRALVATGNPQSPLQLRDVEEPTAAASETIVEVKAASINRGELRLLATRPDGWRPGQDVAGVVVESPSDGLAVDTRVVALVDQAGWAERVAVPANRIATLPNSVSFAQAAALPVAGLTALRALRLGGMLLGQNVLVTGASGGVGHFAVQLAARQGAHVVGISRQPDRAAHLREAGDVRIESDIANVSGRFDLILESVGGDSLTQALRLVARDGKVVMFGNSSQQEARVAFGSIMSSPHAVLYAFFVYESGEPPTFGADLASLAGEIAAGRLLPQIGLEASWRDPMGALDALRERNLEGKAVLKIE